MVKRTFETVPFAFEEVCLFFFIVLVVLMLTGLSFFMTKFIIKNWRKINSWYSKNFPPNIPRILLLNLIFITPIVVSLRQIIDPWLREFFFNLPYWPLSIAKATGLGFLIWIFWSFWKIFFRTESYRCADYSLKSILPSENIIGNLPASSPITSLREFSKRLGLKEEELKESNFFKENLEKLIGVEFNGGVNKYVGFLNTGHGKAMVINGRWRSGKTSFLNIALTHPKYNPCEHIFIRESAISYDNSSESFIDDVVNQIAEASRKTWGIEIGAMINAVSSNLGKRELGLIDNALERVNPYHKTLSQKLIRKINERVCATKPPAGSLLFVIIDDLDRLNGDELRHTFAILATINDLSFVRLILLLDRTAIAWQLEKSDVYMPKEYIKKFIPESPENNIWLEPSYQEAKEIIFLRLKKVLGKKHKVILTPKALDVIWAVFLLDVIDEKANSLKQVGDRLPEIDFNNSDHAEKEHKDKIARDHYQGTSFSFASVWVSRLMSRIWDLTKENPQKLFRTGNLSIDNFWFFGDADKISSEQSTVPLSPYLDILGHDGLIFDFAEEFWFQVGDKIFDKLADFCSKLRGMDLSTFNEEQDEKIFQSIYNRLNHNRVKNISGVTLVDKSKN